MIRKKLLPYEEVAELLTVLLQREIFRLTQGRSREVEGRQAISQLSRSKRSRKRHYPARG